jgi:hypothetical protein
MVEDRPVIDAGGSGGVPWLNSGYAAVEKRGTKSGGCFTLFSLTRDAMDGVSSKDEDEGENKHSMDDVGGWERGDDDKEKHCCGGEREGRGEEEGEEEEGEAPSLPDINSTALSKQTPHYLGY